MATTARACYDLATFAPAALVTHGALQRALRNLHHTLSEAEPRRPVIESLLQDLQRPPGTDGVHPLALALVLTGALSLRI